MLLKFVFLIEIKALHHPLTSNVGEYSTKLLNILVDSPSFNVKREFVNGKEVKSSQIYFKDKKVVYIADSCNGFIAFILLFEENVLIRQ